LQHIQPAFNIRGVATNKDYKTNASEIVIENTSIYTENKTLNQIPITFEATL